MIRALLVANALLALHVLALPGHVRPPSVCFAGSSSCGKPVAHVVCFAEDSLCAKRSRAITFAVPHDPSPRR